MTKLVTIKLSTEFLSQRTGLQTKPGKKEVKYFTLIDYVIFILRCESYRHTLLSVVCFIPSQSFFYQYNHSLRLQQPEPNIHRQNGLWIFDSRDRRVVRGGEERMNERRWRWRGGVQRTVGHLAGCVTWIISCSVGTLAVPPLRRHQPPAPTTGYPHLSGKPYTSPQGR